MLNAEACRLRKYGNSHLVTWPYAHVLQILSCSIHVPLKLKPDYTPMSDYGLWCILPTPSVKHALQSVRRRTFEGQHDGMFKRA